MRNRKRLDGGMMDNLKQTLGELKAIPRERLSDKIKKTILAVLIAGLGVYGAAKWSWPWYVVLPVCMAGAHVASQELTRAAVRFVVSAVKDLVAAVRNGKNGAAT